MSKTVRRLKARRMAVAIGLLILLAAAAGTGWAARAEEDPLTYCQRVFIAGLVKAVAIAVVAPADFNYYFYSSFSAYEYCRRFLG
jgi:hypothetical protein